MSFEEKQNIAECIQNSTPPLACESSQEKFFRLNHL